MLHYKEQIEDLERDLLARMRSDLTILVSELVSLRNRYKQSVEDYERKSLEGLYPVEVMTHVQTIKRLEEAIEQKKREIEAQERKVEKQRQVVVTATQEKKTISKLKEHKYESYLKEVQKSEEQLIEEFVSNQDSTGGAGMTAKNA